MMQHKPPFHWERKEDEPVKGDGFIIVGKGENKTSYRPEDGVEFRPGATNTKEFEAEQKEKAREEQELERERKFTTADHVHDLLEGKMHHEHDSYSETINIKPNGTFEPTRPDTIPFYLTGFIKTPDEFYKIAAEIEKKHPEYHFSFKTDSITRFMYTVERTERSK